jgi:hypothetical protein
MIRGQEGQQVQEVPANLYDDGHELVAVLRANATHGNGILTVALPKSDQTRPSAVRLRKDAGSRHHQEQGHAGREVQAES